MNPAICWGNKIIPRTTTTAAHSRTLPSNLPRTAHCFARCCCQNPRPSSTTERPKSQGRSVVKKALAAPAPRAAANPSGRQQLIVATELTIATNEAETPVPCFMAGPLAGLPALLDNSARRSLLKFGLILRGFFFAVFVFEDGDDRIALLQVQQVHALGRPAGLADSHAAFDDGKE